jgi:hypothetical protein
MYLKDPKDGSVSLTFLVASFVLAVGFSIAAALDQTKNPEQLLQLFYACAALYFGRRVNIGSKTYSSDKDEKSE